MATQPINSPMDYQNAKPSSPSDPTVPATPGPTQDPTVPASPK